MGTVSYVEGTNSESTILDIDPALMGTLLGLVNPIQEIPMKHVKKTRDVFIKILTGVVKKDHQRRELYVMAWKKLLLVSCVLFCSYVGNKDIRTQLGNRLDVLLKDDWRFTLGQFAKPCASYKRRGMTTQGSGTTW